MRGRIQFIHVCFAASFVLAAAAMAVITGLSASRQNGQSVTTQQIIAKAEVEDVYEHVRGQVRQMVYWQDAFANTAVKWNEKWVSYQFGTYQDTMGNHRTAIVGPTGEVRFLHAPAGERALSRDNFQRADGLGLLLRKTKDAGVHQPPPITAGMIVSGGQPYYAVAAPITPEETGDLAAAKRTPFIAIFLKPITAADFSEFSDGFASAEMHVTSDDSHPDGHQKFALKDASGVPVAWLHWKARLPGNDFMRQVTIPLAIVLIVFMLIQFLVINRWIVLQRKMLRAKVEARTAIEQSRLKSVFLGTISHELRTPLNAIIGYADVLCCQLFGPLGSPRNAEYVHDIRTSGRELLKIVNDLIEIARIEARDTCGEDETFDPAHAARQAINTLQDRIQAKALRVALIRPDTPATCRGSMLGLLQAIERILTNSIYHTPEGGGIAIELKNDGNKVIVEIRDEGDGIAPERLADLTRPFGHSDNHLVATGNGMGFGIPIAKGLIKLMGGSFAIESTPGEGTTVRMTLPAEKTPKQSAAAPSGTRYDGRHTTTSSAAGSRR